MSEGRFVDANYKDNKGAVHRIRIQPETAALVIGGVTNTIPAVGAGLVQPRAKVSGGKGQYGLTARRVGIKFGLTPPTGFAQFGVEYLPWLDGDTFPDVAVSTDVTYRGASATFIGTSAERSR